jgi:flavin reductase (DIM6/NTAB) family NADH-FMN oxidoreductase RutF
MPLSTAAPRGSRSKAASAGDGGAEGAPQRENVALELRNHFRSAMRMLASTVALITVASEGRRGGLTATAACSLSLDPPLMLVCINRRSNTHPLIRQSGAFCVNYLGHQHRELAQMFARQLDDAEEKFRLGAWGESLHGHPRLLDALSSIECKVHRRVDEGTHSVFIGKVLSVASSDTVEPLVYAQSGFPRLIPSD